MKKMIKALVIFGAGLYTGVYVAQNYKIVPILFLLDADYPQWNLSEISRGKWKGNKILIDKVEDPKVLFEKAQSFVKNKLAEFSDDSKKGDK